MKFRWIKRLFKETAGQEIAEAAFVLPILFLIVFGILWFARAFSIYSTLNRAANAAAVAGASSTCAGTACSNVPMTQAAVKTNIVDPILVAAHLDPTQVTFSMSQNSNLNGTTPIALGTIVDLSYRFKFGVYGVLNDLNIKAEARALQEN
jgi:Flp pilus assembly protein TadG